MPEIKNEALEASLEKLRASGKATEIDDAIAVLTAKGYTVGSGRRSWSVVVATGDVRFPTTVAELKNLADELLPKSLQQCVDEITSGFDPNQDYTKNHEVEGI